MFKSVVATRLGHKVELRALQSFIAVAVERNLWLAAVPLESRVVVCQLPASTNFELG